MVPCKMTCDLHIRVFRHMYDAPRRPIVACFVNWNCNDLSPRTYQLELRIAYVMVYLSQLALQLFLNNEIIIILRKDHYF